jgi:hypothetical protein
MYAMNKYLRILSLALAAALLASQTLWAAGPVAQPVQPVIWRPQIAIVWPHTPEGDPAPLIDTTLVNISVWPREAVPCDQQPALKLAHAQSNEPTELFPSPGTLIWRWVGQVVFPSVEFNDVLANLRQTPDAQFKFVTYGDVAPSHRGFAGNVWVHAIDPRTILPQPVVPTGRSPAAYAESYDARIQIVYPHDRQGRLAPVAQAPLVNVAVDIFDHGTLQTASPDEKGHFRFGVTLLAAEGNGPVQPVDFTAQQITYTVGSQVFPRWVFNDVPVDPRQQTHFLVSVITAGAIQVASPHTTIWTHATDARTYLPQPIPPPACTPS